MKPVSQRLRLPLCVVCCLFGSASITTGQIIPIKTVPLATGNQLLIFPSENLASGGISIATDDALLDPFNHIRSPRHLASGIQPRDRSKCVVGRIKLCGRREAVVPEKSGSSSKRIACSVSAWDRAGDGWRRTI